MSKKHKEYALIVGLLIVLAVGSLVTKIMMSNNADNITFVEVRHKDEVIQKIDLSVDGTYEIEVELGHLHVEVKNSEYRVFDVDCPDKICEKVGWVSKGSDKLIVCLPNNIVLVQV